MDASNFVHPGGSAVSRASSYKSVPSSEFEMSTYSNYTENDEIALVDSHIHVQGQKSRRRRPGTAIHPANIRRALRNESLPPKVVRFLLNLLPISIILGLITLIDIMSSPVSLFADRSAGVCKPDGTFALTFDSYSPWSRDAVFAINLSFGSYKFGIAKLIDIVWDVVVGRGGQALLAIATYRVFTEVLTYLMESSAVSTSTFEAVTLQNDTITGIYKLIKHFWQTSNARARGSIFCIILSSLSVLAVPTWLSAMTGYSADITAFVQDVNGNLIPAKDFLPWIYTIHDGSRLGSPYTDDFRVIVPWSDYSGVSLDQRGYGCSDGKNYFSIDSNDSYTWRGGVNEDCLLLWLVPRYTSVYGFLGQNDTESLFELPNRTSLSISKPSLNITAYLATYETEKSTQDQSFTQSDEWDKYSWNYNPYVRYWKSDVTHDVPFLLSNPVFYCTGSGTSYNLSQMNDIGSCQQPRQVQYKWGFSFMLLYVFLITSLVWTCVMYALFLDSYYNSRLNAANRQIGLKRAILDLSASMQDHLKPQDTLLTGDSQLCSLVRGNRISYQNLMLDTLPPKRPEGRSPVQWMRREK